MISTSATDHKMFGLFRSFESQIESFLGSVKKKEKVVRFSVGLLLKMYYCGSDVASVITTLL